MANLSRLFRSHKSLLIIFGIVLFTRIVVSGILGYEYINFSSTKEVTKGGTFVEGIYEPISYLPYWGDHQKNQFYQNLLFPGCEGGLEKSLCTISTTDNKTYTISVTTGLNRSDGEPFTLDDVIFSYQDVVISNLWDQPYLSQYQDIFMSEDETNSGNILITFPTESPDNRKFFQLPIIPYHIIQELDLEGYVKKFAAKPVVLSCVALTPSKDSDSLIFDLSNCPNSDINYYQLKTFESIDALEQHINSDKNILSFYYGNTNTDKYSLLPIEDNFFMTMFFNTKSTKLSPRIQRSIAGFIDHNFWQVGHTGYIAEYTGLLDNHQTTGENLGQYIKEKNPYLTYDKALLEQGGVKILPNVFTIDRAKRKSAFYLLPTEQKEYSFTIETTDPVFELKAKTDKSVRYLVTKSENNNKKHTITFSIGDKQQVSEGLNSIIIGGVVLGKKQEIANVDLYYLGQTSDTETINKIKIITLDNTISNYVRLQLQKTFEKNEIQNLFEFKVYTDKDDFLNAITAKDYDMALSTIKMTSLPDLYPILNSQDPQINPSLLLNPLLNQYAAENKRNQFAETFSTEMPFFVVGQMIKPYRINNNITLQYTGSYSDTNVRDIILQHISLVSRTQIKGSDIINPTNIINFIHHYK